MSRLTPEDFPGLPEETVKKLRKIGINTVLGFISQDVQSLSEKTSLPLEELLTTRKRLLVKHSALAWRGDQLFDQMISSLEILQTGCPNLDQLLGGGLYCTEVTELYGLPAVGKTQTCHSVACHVAAQLQRNTIYVDTGGSFCSNRVEEILQRKDERQNGIEDCTSSSMAKIQCIKAFDIYSTLAALDQVKTKLLNWDEEFYQDLALIVVDSVSSIISPILGAQNHGHALMVSLSRVLKSLAVDCNLAVLITNSVVSDRTSTSNSQTKPALGKTWTHVPDNRICLSVEHHHTSSNLRCLKLTKSCRMPLDVVLPAAVTKCGLSNT